MKSRTLTRRAALGALAAAPLLPPAAANETRKRRTFVLVPGTWLGGWVWTPVAEALRARGHRAFCVTCTGVGERNHLLTPTVGLSTHVADVANLISYEGLDEVILVGHSFGGITITGVANELREKIAQLVYYDAFVPTRERPAWVMRDGSGAWPRWWQERQANFVDGYKMNFFAEYPLEMLVDEATYPSVASSVRERLTLHPARQWTEPVSFSNGGWEGLDRTYVHCVGQTFRQSSAAMYGPAKEAGWRFIEAETTRLGMLTHIEETVALLHSLA